MGWDEAIEEYADEGLDLTEAGHESGSSGSGPSNEGFKASWWVERLATTSVAGAKAKRPRKMLAVVSGCTGCSAESSVLTVSWLHQRVKVLGL